MCYVCMCVCVYVCVRVHFLHVCMCVCVYVFGRAFDRACVCVCVFAGVLFWLTLIVHDSSLRTLEVRSHVFLVAQSKRLFRGTWQWAVEDMLLQSLLAATSQCALAGWVRADGAVRGRLT